MYRDTCNLLNSINSDVNLYNFLAPYQLDLILSWYSEIQKYLNGEEIDQDQFKIKLNKIFGIANSLILTSQSRKNLIDFCLQTINKHPEVAISRMYTDLKLLFELVESSSLNRANMNHFQNIIYSLVMFYRGNYNNPITDISTILSYIEPTNQEIKDVINGQKLSEIKKKKDEKELLTTVINNLY